MQITAEIPDVIIPQILETFRAINPDIFIDGIAPTAAVHAVMAHWLRETLVSYAVAQATLAGDTAVAQAAAARDEAIQNARTQTELATKFLEDIITPPPPPEEGAV